MSLALANSDQLYRLARSDKPEDREALAKTMTKLFNADLSEGERFLVQDILLRMLREAEANLRRSLAMHLSTEANCPQALIDFLIFECPLADSEPLLRNSPALSDRFLIEVAKRFDKPAYWRTIAGRKNISSELSLYLINTNDNETHQVLVNNPGSDLSPECMQILTDFAIRNTLLQHPLLQRREITAELAARLYWHSSDKLKQVITQRFDIAKETLEKAMNYVVAKHTTGTRKATIRTIPMEMLGLVRRMPKITTRQVVDAMQKGDGALFACICGAFLKANPENVLFELENNTVVALSALCRAINLTRAEFNHLYLQWRNKEKGTITNATQMNTAMTTFDQMSKEQAEAIIASWKDETIWQA